VVSDGSRVGDLNGFHEFRNAIVLEASSTLACVVCVSL